MVGAGTDEVVEALYWRQVLFVAHRKSGTSFQAVQKVRGKPDENQTRCRYHLSHHVGPTGLLFMSFLSPPCFFSGTLDSGEKEDGTWLISLVEPLTP